MNRQPLHANLILAGLCALTGIAGCDRGGPVIVPVRGTVSHQGTPLQTGGITFVPTEGRSAFGRIIDGQIVDVTTRKTGDGVIVGKATVGIQATTNLGKIEGPHRPLIPPRYFDPATSNLTVEIKADDPNELQFELAD